MTEMLYLQDSYLKEFSAKVEKVSENKFVVLDKTAFFAQGGGQPCDTGFLEKNGKKLKVVFVKKFGNEISHQVENNSLKVGDEVKGIINWQNRYKLMRMHTATHILSAIIFEEIGSLITGNQLGIDKTRIDFNVENFDRDLLKSFEEKTNNAIKTNSGVSISFMPTEEALKNEKLFRLKDVLPKNLKELRIVKIGDIDVQADGGTHVKNTQEIGQIKIIKMENKGKNNRRIYFELDD